MFEHKKINVLNDYFLSMGDRKEKGIYFYRINRYSEEVAEFIEKYYEISLKNGLIIENKLNNPDKNNLAYYEEIMGNEFYMQEEFILKSLIKWLPRVKEDKKRELAKSLYITLLDLQKSGKTISMIKNAYIKFMCWLYYRMERILNALGENKVPKLLYEGSISNYELMMLSIISRVGCDVILLQYNGDENYLKIDKNSSKSENMPVTSGTDFPEDFNIRKLMEKRKNKLNNRSITANKITMSNKATLNNNSVAKNNSVVNNNIAGTGDSIVKKNNIIINDWIVPEYENTVTTEDLFKNVLKNQDERGSDGKIFHSCFGRINGTESRIEYKEKLYKFYCRLRDAGINNVIVNKEIKKPTVEEIKNVNRRNYSNINEMLLDLSRNMKDTKYSLDSYIQNIIINEFMEILREEQKIKNYNLSRLMNKAVYIICWFRRYRENLFKNIKNGRTGCFIYFGYCRDDNESIFIKFLSRLPIDVLIINPDLQNKCMLEDDNLIEINNEESSELSEYPNDEKSMQIETVAYHAEKDLDEILYNDTGLYGEKQYIKANSIKLNTIYEEIKILWDEELKYRSGFDTIDGTVNMPVIFSKISGIKDGDKDGYWNSIRELITDDTILIDEIPYINSEEPNPVKPYAPKFFKNGKLQRETIKNSKGYKYDFLRDEIQDYILDKLDLMIQEKIIKGTFENGTEYTVIATVLNMNMDILRLIQKFDFVKKNPKIIYINTKEKMISLEDSILIAFLNLVGFDVVFFIPTGYKNIEKHINIEKMPICEHNVGEYVYDLRVPDIRRHISKSNVSWFGKFIKKGM